VNIHEIVKKLVGPIKPIGETNTDNDRFENLKTLIDLVDELLQDVDFVSVRYKKCEAFSMKRSGECASKFLDRLGIPE